MHKLGIQIAKVLFIIGYSVFTTALAQEGLAVTGRYEQNSSALPHLPTLQLAEEAAATNPLWKEGKGQAMVTRSGGSLGKPHRSSLDLLLPLCHTEGKLLLIQGGLNRRNKEATWTLGMGQRYFQIQSSAGYWGYNLFYDHRQQGHHQRLSAGVEGRFHAITGSFNGYFPVSHKQITANQYSWVSPAYGLSLHLCYPLAHAPHWRFTLVGERYFGTFLEQDLENWQQDQNPNAMTLGIDYTPCPLITASYGFKLKKDNQPVHQLQLALNFYLGLPLARHLDLHPVDSTHISLVNRLALVQRHSQVILQQRPYNKPVSVGVQEEQASNPQKIQQQEQDVEESAQEEQASNPQKIQQRDQDIEESAYRSDMAAQAFNSMLSVKQEKLLRNIKKYYNNTLIVDKKLLNEIMTNYVISAQKEYLEYAMETLYDYSSDINNGQFVEKCNILQKEHNKLHDDKGENHRLHKKKINDMVNVYLIQRGSFRQQNPEIKSWFVDIEL